MLKINLPKNLETEYTEIVKEFSKIHNDWQKYTDQIIPQDTDFAKRIIRFTIQVIDYTIGNYDIIEVSTYQQFLACYHYEFYYGTDGDNSNYLEFDEISLSEFCNDLMDDNVIVTKEKLQEIKTKYEEALTLF